MPDTAQTGSQDLAWKPWGLAVLGLLLTMSLGLMRADRWPLTGDEALYAFWARHWLENRDPLFLAHWIDKPPVYLWLQSLSLYTFGPQAASARYVNILATSLLSLGLGSFAWQQWGRSVACLCFFLTVANPLVLAYGPTGLTDPVCVLAGIMACLLAWQQRCGAAGVALAISIFAKQSGLLYLPLAAGTMWLFRSSHWRRDTGLWMRGLLSVALPILIWDGIRMIWAPSFWYAGFDHYAPLRFVPVTDLGPRLTAWMPLYRSLWGSWLGWAAWGLLVLAAGRIKLHAPWCAEDRWIGLVLVWSIGYALLHWLLTFNPWPRYLLPLVPGLILSTVWAVHTGWPAAHARWQQALLLLLLLLLLLAVITGWGDGWHGTLPEMQDNAGLAGLPDALEQLRTVAPAQSVILHRELSWHFLFYLFDYPAPVRIWFADAAQLAELVAMQPADTAIFQLRLSRDAVQTAAIAAALQTAGYHPVLCRQEAEVGIYEIRPAPATACRFVRFPESAATGSTGGHHPPVRVI